MRGALVYCLVVDLTISVLVSVGLLFHDVEFDVGGKAAKGFPEQQCLGAEARHGGFVKLIAMVPNFSGSFQRYILSNLCTKYRLW